jgi:cytochrome c oxidase cbb3-type subunit 4
MAYETLRQFADSWGLLYLFLIFIVVVAYVFRPGSSRKARDAARIPFDRD